MVDRLRKMFAVAVSGSILAAQLWAALPPGHSGWYWPFLHYPMYSYAHYRGEAVTEYWLHAAPCGDVGRPVLRTSKDLGISRFTYRALLEEASGFQHGKPAAPRISDAAADQLERLVSFRWPGEYCRLQVREERYLNGATTAGFPEPVRSVTRDWVLPVEAADAEREADL